VSLQSLSSTDQDYPTRTSCTISLGTGESTLRGDHFSLVDSSILRGDHCPLGESSTLRGDHCPLGDNRTLCGEDSKDALNFGPQVEVVTFTDNDERPFSSCENVFHLS